MTALSDALKCQTGESEDLPVWHSEQFERLVYCKRFRVDTRDDLPCGVASPGVNFSIVPGVPNGTRAHLRELAGAWARASVR
jgi:hypothetical protein